jgi:hypothetical protein
VLYEAVTGEWGCQTCWGLPSPTSGKPIQDRVTRRLRKLRRYCEGSEDLSQPFPARPAGMMPATYAMLREEARQLEEVLTRTLVLGPAYIAHGVRRAHANWYPAKNAAARRKGAKPL